MREKHDNSATGKMKSNFRQFLGKAKGKAKTSLSIITVMNKLIIIN